LKYYLIAGERSGDLHGSNLIKAIRQHDPHAECRAWGGNLMQEAGATLVQHYDQMAFMGLWEVIKNVFTIKKFLQQCKDDIVAWQPDVVVLIDYGGFNMKIARFAKENGIKTFYYISPKVWAWNQRRALNIKRFVDKMFVILPFEKEFFKKFDYEVDYVGNPLLDAIEGFSPNPNFTTLYQLNPSKTVALLPGSRRQEVVHILPMMLEVSTQFPEYQFVLAKVSNLPEAFYADMLKGYPHVRTITDDTYNLLSVAKAALVTSGTATLETALFGVPQVVCYKTSWLTAYIARKVMTVQYLSLVNLIANKEVVKEIVQEDMTAANVAKQLAVLLPNDSLQRQQVLADYANIKTTMGGAGASERAGELMVKYVLQVPSCE
jgi:lipid-A-disaccharide synthase